MCFCPATGTGLRASRHAKNTNCCVLHASGRLLHEISGHGFFGRRGFRANYGGHLAYQGEGKCLYEWNPSAGFRTHESGGDDLGSRRDAFSDWLIARCVHRRMVATPSTAHTSFSGRQAFTTFTPGSVHTYVKPGQDAYVRVLKVPPGAAPPPGALSAAEIVRFIGPRLQS